MVHGFLGGVGKIAHLNKRLAPLELFSKIVSEARKFELHFSEGEMSWTFGTTQSSLRAEVLGSAED
jgi:hypothetical protein